MYGVVVMLCTVVMTGELHCIVPLICCFCPMRNILFQVRTALCNPAQQLCLACESQAHAHGHDTVHDLFSESICCDMLPFLYSNH